MENFDLSISPIKLNTGNPINQLALSHWRSISRALVLWPEADVCHEPKGIGVTAV
jgi:hypothetical protein